MSFRKKHWVLGASILAASALVAGCGGSDSTMEDEMPAAAPTPTPAPTPEPMATPTGAIDGIPQTTGFMAALGAALAELGDDVTMKDHPMMAGEVWSPGGLMFTCAADAGDGGCLIKLTLGEDGMITADYEGGMVTAAFINPFAQMNAADAAKIGAIIGRGNSERAGSDAAIVSGELPLISVTGFDRGSFAAYTDRVDRTMDPIDDSLPARVAGPQLDSTTLGGVKSSDATPGIGAANLDEFALSGSLDPNNPTSMITAKVDATTGDSDDITMSMGGAVGLGAPWQHKVLHADWGDTSTPNHDGGFETIAVVYSDMEAPTPTPFADVGKMVIPRVLETAGALDDHYFEVDLVTGEVMIYADANRVSDDGSHVPDPNPASAIRITVEEATIARLKSEVDIGEQFTGTYYGAPGTFTCIGEGMDASASGCVLSRKTTGDTDYRVHDANGADAGLGPAGNWSFKPDAGAMVAVPDQDWVAFGFWMTAPDDGAIGNPRLGVFYDGMETYNYAGDGVVIPTASEAPGNGGANGTGYYDNTLLGLRGSATFDGDAAGYYVNGMDDGMFTANASLTAIFNDGPASTNDHMLSGRIDNFRNTDGSFISSDSPSDPNDPNRGGEGDWYVNLMRTNIGTTDADGAAAADYGALDTGAVADVLPAPPPVASGSADGVSWTGEWQAAFYGPGHRASGKKAPPTGVAGAFRVIGSLGDAGHRGVVGAFGAQRTSATGP
jgi:hypothetical protein